MLQTVYRSLCSFIFCAKKRNYCPFFKVFFFVTEFHLAAKVTVLIKYICFCFALIFYFHFLGEGVGRWKKISSCEISLVNICNLKWQKVPKSYLFSSVWIKFLPSFPPVSVFCHNSFKYSNFPEKYSCLLGLDFFVVVVIMIMKRSAIARDRKHHEFSRGFIHTIIISLTLV